MRIIATTEIAVHGLGTKPSRTFLTLLGIAIGVAAVITIASLGAGTQLLITDEISGLGADVIAVQPGRNTTGLADIASRLYAKSLDSADVDALRRTENVPHAVSVEPIVMVPGSVSFESQTYYPQIVGGSAELYQQMFDIYPAEGDMFGDTEIREKASIAVIGYKVNLELFSGRSGYGEKITIGGKKFRVTGVLPQLGQVAFAQVDDMVLIPHTTAQTYLLGQKHYNEFIVQVDDPVHVARTEEDIKRTLRETHKLDDGEESDFVVQTPSALIEQVGTILDTLTLFLTAVVAIALVVGGIGIMNIMLVSVTERTREIGLRKAVGATDANILTQFLLEAMLLTMLGGAFGIVLGAGAAYGASVAIRAFSTLNWAFVFPLEAASIALLFSAFIGLVFGLYPARKASKKSPMEALRYE
ncbi:MAG: ABC transporter permease [Candidatus Pacebacteria bacterium]|nr:ABC transporter permease [Candidatus Paceibacterota bacterium]